MLLNRSQIVEMLSDFCFFLNKFIEKIALYLEKDFILNDKKVIQNEDLPSLLFHFYKIESTVSHPMTIISIQIVIF